MIDLRQGDCLELLKDIPDGSVDMVLCDLPYGTTAYKWDTCIPFEPHPQYFEIVKKRIEDAVEDAVNEKENH